MRILLLSPVLPYPPNWGFATRVYQLLRNLAQRHDVSLLSYSEVDEGPDVAALRAICASVHIVPRVVTPRRKRADQLASLFSWRSFQTRIRFTESMQCELDELTRRQRFDVIQVESSQLACFRFDPTIPLVIDEHNIEYELLYRTYLTEASSLRRFYSWIEFFKFRREEIRSWRHAQGVLTTSAREAEIVRDAAPATATCCIPNAVDAEFFAPSSERPEPHALVFTGLMKYRPNGDAAVFFVREVLPRILTARPNTVFYIVGGEPPDEVRELACRNVVVTGSVPDVRPYVYNATAFVVPLRMGSGTRLKVLEGLAMGKPMVSTSLGCEGIDVEDNKHLLIRDDPASFAAAVLRLLDDHLLAAALAKAGLDLIRSRYRWESVAAKLEAFYETLDGQSHRGAGAWADSSGDSVASRK